MKGRSLSRCAVACFCALLVIGCTSPEAKKAKFYSKGKALFDKGDYVKASLEFKNAVQVDPKYSDAWRMLGKSAMMKGNVKEAFGDFSRAAELDPANSKAQYELGVIFLAVRQFAEAMEKSDLILRREPGNIDGLLLRGAVFVAEKENDKARLHLEGMVGRGIRKPDVYLLLATVYEQDRDPKKTENILLRGVEANPRCSPIYLKLAALYEQEKRDGEAVAMMRKVIGLEPGNPAYRIGLAGFLWDRGRQAEASGVLEQITAADEKNEARRLQVAGFYAARDRFTDAERELKRGITIVPGSIRLRLALSGICFASNRGDEGIAVLRECLTLGKREKDADLIGAKNELAKRLLAAGKIAEASAITDEVLKTEPKNADALFTRGRICLVKGDGVNAVASFGAVVSDYPQLPMGYVFLAHAYMANRNPKLANEALQKALGLDPGSREIQREAVRVYAEQKDFRRAEDQLRKLIAANPDDLESRADLGDLFMFRKDFGNAEVEYSALKKRAAGLPLGYVKLSGLCLARGDVDGAIREMAQAVRLSPQSEGLFSTLVGLNIRRNRSDRAIALCESRIVRNPRDEIALGLLGQVFNALRDYPNAIVNYRKVMAINPNNWLAANNLAFLINESATTGKGLDEALYWAQRAERIKPGEATVLDTLGWIYLKKGETDKAVAELARARAMAPWSRTVNYHLGMGLYKKGDKAGARKYLEKAVSAGGDFAGRDEARMILAKP